MKSKILSGDIPVYLANKIEKEAMLVKNGKKDYELLFELLFPTMQFVAKYNNLRNPQVDETEFIYAMMKITFFAIENYKSENGCFFKYWRYMVKLVNKRVVSKMIRNQMDVSLLDLDKMEFVYSDDERQNRENLLCLEESMDKIQKEIGYKSLNYALLNAMGFSSREIGEALGQDMGTVRRRIRLVSVMMYQEKGKSEF